MSKLFIISLGGSLIVPESIDVGFVKKFKAFIRHRVANGDRFILVVGGGRTCRVYQKSLRSISAEVQNNELDWMGIYATRLNAQLIRLAFSSLAHPKVVDDPNRKVIFKEKVLIADGWKPGRSTDDDAVRLAKIYGSSTIINLSNIDYLYTKDPRKFKYAKKIESISWGEYRKLIGNSRSPGMNVPFDPVASTFAHKHGQKVYIANGKNLKNLGNILDGKKFVGTVIE